MALARRLANFFKESVFYTPCPEKPSLRSGPVRETQPFSMMDIKIPYKNSPYRKTAMFSPLRR